jgi:integrase
MSIKWIKTAHKGLRYYEHPTRRHGKKRDRYYAIRFKVASKDYGYGVGWWSDGIPEAALINDPDMGFEEYALTQLKLYKANVKAGSGPKSPKEKRQIEGDKKVQLQAEQVRLEKDAVTFDTFFTDTYLPLAKSSKKESSTTREEGLYSVWIKPVIGHLPLKEVAPFTLEKLKQRMAGKKQAPRSIEYALAVIRQVYNTAKRSGAYLGESPTVNVKRPKIDNGRMRYLTRKEADAILAALKDKSPDVHDQTLLSLHAGLRFGEIASLTWQDIDLTKGVLTIRDAKAGSRYAFLTEQAAAMLKARTEGKPSDYVFQGRKGKLGRISPTFFRAVEDLKLNKGIDDPRLKICFHSCRHSYASWLIDQGADLYTVQKLLGHKTNVMTQRYAHLSENRLRDAAMALGAAWIKQEPTEEGVEEAGEVVNGKK